MASISIVIHPYVIAPCAAGEITVTQQISDQPEQRITLTLDQLEIFSAHLSIVAREMRNEKVCDDYPEFMEE